MDWSQMNECDDEYKQQAILWDPLPQKDHFNKTMKADSSRKIFLKTTAKKKKKKNLCSLLKGEEQIENILTPKGCLRGALMEIIK